MPEQNDNISSSYDMSPGMIFTKITCNGINATVDKIKAMDIDRRWNEDNRIPTWTQGVVNMAHDFNFMHNANIVCDTDDMVLKIEKDVETVNGVERKIVGTRNIKYNGQGLQIVTNFNENQ